MRGINEQLQKTSAADVLSSRKKSRKTLGGGNNDVQGLRQEGETRVWLLSTDEQKGWERQMRVITEKYYLGHAAAFTNDVNLVTIFVSFC